MRTAVAQTGLIADIGATNARFAMAGLSGVSDELILPCDDYPSLIDATKGYLSKVGAKKPPVQASFAIAGPVTGDWFDMTNHPWSFSVEQTRDALNLERLDLFNDFEAVAMSVPHLKGEDVRQVVEGKPLPDAPIIVIGPGTGLGVASLFWDGQSYRTAPGEGGHVTVPAQTQREYDIFEYLREVKYSHVSAERVCSGKGLENLYNALRGLDKRDDLPDKTPAEISKAAIDGSCELCAEALDLMMRFLGSVTGNLALSLGAHGGIYIAGGIVKKLGDYFDSSSYRSSFLAKGRFEKYLETIPTYIIEHDFPAFVGLHANLVGQMTPNAMQRNIF